MSSVSEHLGIGLIGLLSHKYPMVRSTCSDCDAFPCLCRRPTRLEPCICGGKISVVGSEDEFVIQTVYAHNRTPAHARWRKANGL